MKKFKKIFLSTVAIVCSVWAFIILIVAGVKLFVGKEEEFWLLICFVIFWLGVSKLALFLRKRMDEQIIN